MRGRRETLFAIVFGASATTAIAGSGCNGSIYAGSAIDEDAGPAIDSGTKDSAKDVEVDSTIFGCDAAGPCDGDGCNIGVAPTAAELDANRGWKPPAAPSATACSDQDLATLLASFESTAITGYNQLENGLSTSCVSCLFTDDNAPNWSIVVLDYTNPANGFVNFGACYAAELGDACGKAEQYYDFCISLSCSGCSSDADFANCVNLASVKQACETNFGALITSSCDIDGGAAGPYADTCNNAIKAAAVLCGGNAPDGG